MRDEGRSLGIGLQDQIPNTRKLLGPKAPVVSVSGKGRTRSSQVRAEKTNASEPLMRCRKRRNVTETRLQSLAWDPAEARPAYGLGGDRHKGGVISVRALAGNVGSWVTMSRESHKGKTPEGDSTKAWRRVGSTHSSVDAW